MSKPLIKVLWFKVSDPSTGINLTDAIDMQLGRGLDVKNNTASLFVKNTAQTLNVDSDIVHKYINPDFTFKFDEQDQIKIYLKYTDDMADVEADAWNNEKATEPTSDDLKGVFYIIDIGTPQDTKSTTIKISCVDKTYILFNRLLAKNFPLKATSGTTTSTTASKLVHSAAKFTRSANVGMKAVNTTDATEARVTAIDSDTTLSLSADVFATGEDYELRWTAPSIIQKVVRFSSQAQGGLYTGTGSDSGVKYDVDALMETDEGGFIQDVRKNTTEKGNSNTDLLFPEISVAKVWKPVYEWLDELSQIENLNTANELTTSSNKELVYGRSFFYYIDENNKFHWIETDNVIGETVTIGTTSGIYKYSLVWKTFDTVNMIIFRGGEDFYGKGTLDYVIDETFTGKTKKMRVVAMTDIAKKLIQAEIALGNLVSNTSGSFTFSGNRYNRNGTVTASWNNTDYSTDSTYNAALKAEILRLGNNRARALIQGLNSPRYKGTIERKGTIVTPGTLLSLTNKKMGQNAILIRVKDVRDQVNKNGWFTTLQLEQDDEALIQLEAS